jgi:hypothetical protein
MSHYAATLPITYHSSVATFISVTPVYLAPIFNQLVLLLNVTPPVATIVVCPAPYCNTAISVPIGKATLALVGTVTASGSSENNVTGFAVPTLLGQVSLVTNNFIDVTGFSIPVQLGNVDVNADGTVDVTGVYAVGRVGTVDAQANSVVDLTGVRTVVRLKRVNVWGLINPVQSPNWTEIDPENESGWTEISPSQTPNWSNVLVPSGFDEAA